MQKSILFIYLIYGIFYLPVSAQSPGEHLNKDKKNRAVEGYDVVSYFNDSDPQNGSSNYNSTYQGAEYWFENSKNKALFDQDPEKYVPQYGGWCAYAMGVTGDKVEVDVETFKIKDGKLYLFYNAFFNNTLPKWNEDEEDLKLKADQFWTGILEK